MDFSHLDPTMKPFAARAWSHTAAQSCALSLLAREQGVVGPGRADRFLSLDRRDRGSALHVGAEWSIRGLKAKGKFPDPDRVMRKMLTDFEALRAHEVVLTEKLALWQEKFEFDIDRELACEWRMAVTEGGELCSYDDPPPGAWRVRVDWAQVSKSGRLRVIDYKNQPYISSDGEMRRHEQLAGYAWALACLSPKLREQPCDVGIYYFEYGVTRVVEMTWDVIDALHARQRRRATAKASLRVMDVRPEPGYGRCQYCDVLELCPAAQELLAAEQLAPTDLATAQELAKRVFVIEEVAASGRKALKKFAQEFGTVEVDEGLGFGYKVTSSNIVDLPKVIQGLQALDVPLHTVLRLDLDAAKKQARTNEGVETLLAQHVKRQETGTEFSDYKPKIDKVITVPLVRDKVKRGKAADKKGAKKL